MTELAAIDRRPWAAVQRAIEALAAEPSTPQLARAGIMRVHFDATELPGISYWRLARAGNRLLVTRPGTRPPRNPEESAPVPVLQILRLL